MHDNHKLIIVSLNDAQATCKCMKWWLVATGARTKKDIKGEYNKHLPVHKCTERSLNNGLDRNT